MLYMLKRIVRNRIVSTIGLTIALIGGPIIFLWLLANLLGWSLSKSLGDTADYDQSLRHLRLPKSQWATDSRQLVFFHNGTMHVVDSVGSQLRSLDDAIFPDVSPDGTRIAYTAYEHSTGWFPWNKDRNWEIVSSKLDGSDRRRLTETFGIDTNPVWSPDGDRIAFVSLNEEHKHTIHVVRADGSDAQSLASLTAAKLPAVWSSDGRNIAFVSGAVGWQTTCDGERISTQPLYVVRADGSEPVRVGRVLNPILPTWSSDGRRVVFASLFEADCRLVEIRSVSLDGSESNTILLFPRYNDAGLLDTPAWSPDGSEFLLGTFIFKADGSSFRTLPTREGLASWSPDGSRIAVHLPIGGYSSSTGAKYYASGVLYTVAADGTDVRVLVEQDEDGNLLAANGRPLSDDRDIFETNSRCLEFAEPGVLKYCDEE